MLPFEPQPVTRDGAQADARRELSKGIYHRYDDPWPVAVFKAVVHFIGHLLDGVADNAPGGGAGAIGLVLVVVVLLVVARWRLGPIRREHRLASGPVLDDQPRSAADHRRTAESAAAAGDWGTAVIERMRATARDLEERGTLDVRPGRTADELAREVVALLPTVADPLRVATATFDAVAYGRRTADASAYRSMVAADDAVTQQRRVPAGRAG